MPEGMERAIIRVVFPHDQRLIYGAGFLVDDCHALTCAHVVERALGAGEDESIPEARALDQEVWLDFPMVASLDPYGSGVPSRARVVVWKPSPAPMVAESSRQRDIALLELCGAPPPGAEPIRLYAGEEIERIGGHDCRAYGVPLGDADGQYAHGTIGDRVAGGIRQIDHFVQRHSPHKGYAIRPGYSGTPVWDSDLSQVVGMVVAADDSHYVQTETARFLPTPLLLDALPSLPSLTLSHPYQGLYAFEAEHKDVFFGREAMIQVLGERIQREPLVAVVGASGRGKSSLVRAGLLPRLDDSWLVVPPFRPGDTLTREAIPALAWALAPLFETEESRQRAVAQRLEEDLRRKLQNWPRVMEQVLKKHPDKRCLLLVLDQFEQVRWAPDRDRFLDGLLALTDQQRGRPSPAVTILLTLRSDYESRFRFDSLAFGDALKRGREWLRPMRWEELQEAIERPAALFNVRIERGVTDQMVKAVEAEPGNLPLLELALSLLWDKRRDGRITREAYEEIGGIEDVLTRYADHVFEEELSPEEQEQAERIFIQLAIPGEDTRRVATVAEVGEENWELVTRLADARLLVTGYRGEQRGQEGERTVEVAHEVLIRGWPRFQSWMERNQEFRTWQEKLRIRLRTWEESGRDEGELWQGTQVVEAERWLTERGEELTGPEQSFIQASITLRDRELAKERQRQQEREEHQRRELEAAQERERAERNHRQIAEELATTRGRGIRRVSTLAVFLFIALIVAGLFYRGEQLQRHQAQQEAQIARSHELAADALPLLSTNPELAVILALRASRLADTPQAEFALRKAILASNEKLEIRVHPPTTGYGSDILQTFYSPDGRIIVAESDHGQASAWNALTGKFLATYTNNGWIDTDIRAFSPDDKYVVVTDEQGKAWEEDAATGRVVRRFPVAGSVLIGSFSPDGRLLVFTGVDRTGSLTQVWSTDPVRMIARFHFPGPPSMAPPYATFMSLGTSILIHETSHVYIWRYLQHSATALPLSGRTVDTAIVSPNSRTIVTASKDPTGPPAPISLWDAHTGQRLWDLPGPPTTIENMTFSANSRYLLESGTRGSTKVWDVRARRLVDSLPSSESSVAGAAMSPDAAYVATADGAVAKVWSLTTKSLIETLRGHQGEITSIAFHPSGTSVATASSDGSVRLWGLRSQLTPVMHPTSNSGIVALSQDGRRVLLSRSNGTYSVWSVASRHLISTLHPVPSAVRDLALNPSGTCVAGIYSRPTGRHRTAYTLTYIYVWNSDSGQLTTRLSEPRGNSVHATLSPDCRRVVTTSFMGPLRLRSTLPEAHSSVLLQRSQEYMEPTFNHSGSLFALMGQFEFQPPIYNSKTGAQEFILRGHSEQVNDLKFSPNDKYIATASNDRTVRIWNATNGNLVHTFGGAGNAVDGVEFSSDGRSVLSWSEDGTIRVWRVDDGHSVALIDSGSTPEHAAFLGGGRFLITWGRREQAVLWDAPTGQPLLMLGDGIDTLIPFQNGWTLLLQKSNGAIYSFDCTVCQPVSRLMRVARGLVTRRPTRQERELYGL